mmetsp:Transcript_14043/g.13653  ORF Transcript_14043/g.13653 Transcript_14043/m.13653 type:complete len:160 (+) Transcript_14043:55-534(+)
MKRKFGQGLDNRLVYVYAFSKATFREHITEDDVLLFMACCLYQGGITTEHMQEILFRATNICIDYAYGCCLHPFECQYCHETRYHNVLTDFRTARRKDGYDPYTEQQQVTLEKKDRIWNISMAHAFGPCNDFVRHVAGAMVKADALQIRRLKAQVTAVR